MEFASKLRKIDQIQTPEQLFSKNNFIKRNSNIHTPHHTIPYLSPKESNYQILHTHSNNINNNSQSTQSLLRKAKSRISNKNFNAGRVKGNEFLSSPKVNWNQLIADLPRFNLNLTPLDLTDNLPYSEILRKFKENNKFLFEVTDPEKNLNEKIKSFNYDKIILADKAGDTNY